MQTRLFASIFYAEKNTLNKINSIENNSWKEHWTAPSLSPWLSHIIPIFMVGYTSLKSTIFVQFLSASRGASGGPAARGADGVLEAR